MDVTSSSPPIKTSPGHIQSREESTGDDATATAAMGADNGGLRLPHHIHKVNMLDSHVILNLPLSAKTVTYDTRKNPILAKLLHFVTNGWPTT